MVPTIRDVAKRAGVSISTVSRVLNGSASVHEEKKARVRAAADELGYRPNPAALSLLGQRVGGVGVLLPYIAGDIFSEFLSGIDRITSQQGRFLMVSSSHRNDAEFRAVLRGLERRVDGLIVMSTEFPAETVRAWLPADLPLVFANTEVHDPEITAVNADNRGGAFRMTEHLVERGHRQIAFLKGPDGTYDAEERLTGFREGLAAHGLEPVLELPCDFTLECGEDTVPAILAADPRPTAVFAANDDSAFGLLTGLREAGLRVPEDIAIAGVDDSKFSQLAIPSLTTVRMPMRQMGRTAIERLLAEIDGTNGGSHGLTVLPTELVLRQSTA
ncbi:MAG: LacI family DNA-binding transcriptional regulator [Bacteroidota bacterium]